MERKNSKNEFVRGFQDRTKKFAAEIIQFSQMLPNSREGRIISNQLIRCVTSVGSNYRAACRGRSRKEFYAKISIVVEEADETLFWLELIKETKLITDERLEALLKEANEILSIIATSRKTAGLNLDP